MQAARAAREFYDCLAPLTMKKDISFGVDIKDTVNFLAEKLDPGLQRAKKPALPA